jgi:hypothetical protein
MLLLEIRVAASSVHLLMTLPMLYYRFCAEEADHIQILIKSVFVTGKCNNIVICDIVKIVTNLL